MRHIRLKLFALLCFVIGFHLGKAAGRDEIRAKHQQDHPTSYVKG